MYEYELLTERERFTGGFNLDTLEATRAMFGCWSEGVGDRSQWEATGAVAPMS